VDDLRLKKTVQHLCTTKIRHPLTKERVNTWLKQFDKGPEHTLALLLLTNLIYRTNSQIESSLGQALRRAALHFAPTQEIRENVNWRRILGKEGEGLYFMFGPPAHADTPPGKSGELISRLLKTILSDESINFYYLNRVTQLESDERYLLIDDGTFTGDQMHQIIEVAAPFMKKVDQTGIIVSIAHERAIEFLTQKYPGMNIFYGEIIKYQDGLNTLSDKWVLEDQWPYRETTPLQVYLDVCERKGCFEKKLPLGFGSLGLLVAYEHGIPDDSLQLLWGKSDVWQPLINR